MPGPDHWLVLSLDVSRDDPLKDLAVEGLLALGGLSVEEDGSLLTTYLEAVEDVDGQATAAERFMADWLATDCPPVVWRLQPNEDWEREWRRGLQPRKVSPRLVVKPSWTEWAGAPEEVVLQIDPQMAFGTGEHATTRGCLRLIDETVRPGDRVLDIGSGSGILSIAAALLGASEVVAVEFDPDANINAEENITANGASDRIRLIEAMADPPMLSDLGRFDLILANILSGVVIPLLPAIAAALPPGGNAIVSGILQTERAAVITAAEAAGFRSVAEIAEEEWWSAALRKTGAPDEAAPQQRDPTT